ncbi:MAG TPA: DUF2384 domain-containing protein [Chloroflexi bacterium]|nr:DUF2384 domain-containing protein [Chloroflexota bacterium]
MSKKRSKRHQRFYRQKPSAPRAPEDVRLTTPEGDSVVLTSARYRHAAQQEIRSTLQAADDFGLDDDLASESDGPFHFPWYETRPDAPPTFAPIGRRILAQLTLTPTALRVKAPSRRRLTDCRRRLEQLLGDRIELVEIKTEDQALRDEPAPEPAEPFIPPPELVAELEEKMLRQWIDESIPALDGLTPREAVQTAEGREKVLALIDHIGRMQSRGPKRPGMFSPDYRKVIKMLGLE